MEIWQAAKAGLQLEKPLLLDFPGLQPGQEMDPMLSRAPGAEPVSDPQAKTLRCKDVQQRKDLLNGSR